MGPQTGIQELTYARKRYSSSSNPDSSIQKQHLKTYKSQSRSAKRGIAPPSHLTAPLELTMSTLLFTNYQFRPEHSSHTGTLRNSSQSNRECTLFRSEGQSNFSFPPTLCHLFRKTYAQPEYHRDPFQTIRGSRYPAAARSISLLRTKM